MRIQKVVVAIVQRGIDEFLVTYNSNWNGYAFPMKAVDDDQPVLASMAIDAVREDLGLSLPKATAEELEYFGAGGVSQRTGEPTEYHYSIFAVDPGEPLALAAAAPKSRRPLFGRFAALLTANDITWSTAGIVRDFVENQKVALSVVTRPGETETEFLLVENKSYAGLFFPCQRMKSEVMVRGFAKHTVRHELVYHGEIISEWLAEVPDVHFSNRYFRDRRYNFQICETRLPDFDIHLSFNRFERGMLAQGKKFAWYPKSQVSSLVESQRTGRPADPPLSPTLAAVWPTIAQAVPDQMIPQPIRISEGGIALIATEIGGETHWLAQFNEGWKAFFLVGGHREPPESYRDCTIREIEEELGLGPGDCPVSPAPVHQLQYLAHSRSANRITKYHLEVFEAHPTPAGLKKIAANPMNRFLTAREILRLGADDGRNVSETMLSVLGQTGIIDL